MLDIKNLSLVIAIKRNSRNSVLVKSSYVAMSKKFGISQNTLRTGIKSLSDLGWIRVCPVSGNFIVSKFSSIVRDFINNHKSCDNYFLGYHDLLKSSKSKNVSDIKKELMYIGIFDNIVSPQTYRSLQKDYIKSCNLLLNKETEKSNRNSISLKELKKLRKLERSLSKKCVLEKNKSVTNHRSDVITSSRVVADKLGISLDSANKLLLAKESPFSRTQLLFLEKGSGRASIEKCMSLYPKAFIKPSIKINKTFIHFGSTVVLKENSQFNFSNNIESLIEDLNIVKKKLESFGKARPDTSKKVKTFSINEDLSIGSIKDIKIFTEPESISPINSSNPTSIVKSYFGSKSSKESISYS